MRRCPSIDHDIVEHGFFGSFLAVTVYLDLKPHSRSGFKGPFQNRFSHTQEAVFICLRKKSQLTEFYPQNGNFLVTDPADRA
jgi:hypothetical protein